jgi:hypothetical protein
MNKRKPAKIELHCHTAPRSRCAESPADELMEAYEEAGYAVVFITDHDTVWSNDELSALRARHSSLTIIPGIERTVGRGLEHLLILGTNDPSYLATRQEDILINKARADGLLTVLAHPFIMPESAEMLRRGIHPDAIEYRTGSQGVRDAKKAHTVSLALKRPLLNSGDVHHTSQVNQFWIETLGEVRSISDLRGIILGGAYGNRHGTKGTHRSQSDPVIPSSLWT